MCSKSNLTSRLIKKSEYMESSSNLDNNNIISLFPESTIYEELKYDQDETENIELKKEEYSGSDEFYENETIKNCLEKYLLFHTTQYCLYIWDPSKDIHSRKKTKKNFLGKINLLRNYLKTVFTQIHNFNYATIYQTKFYINSSR